MVDHLELLSTNHDERTRTKAMDMHSYITNKDALLTISFLLDIQEIMKKESKEYQKKGETMIGLKKRRDHLLYQLENLRTARGDRWTNSLLLDTTCQPFTIVDTFIEDVQVVFDQKIYTGPETGCYTFERYEDMDVRYNGVLLSEDTNGDFQHLSTFYEDYINKVIVETERRLPDETLINVSSLLLST